MSDFPRGASAPLLVHTYSPAVSPVNQLMTLAATNSASLTWVANLVTYVPVYLPWPYPVSRVFWVNGSSIGSNVNFGIFNASGKKLYATGSTAQSGTSAPQFVTPTAFTLAAGLYYFAYACDGTTNRGWGAAVTVVRLQQTGVLQQTANFALTDPAVFATPASAVYPMCGITRSTSLPF